MAKKNLKSTQKGYVPLRDRFKSFPVDRMPKDDVTFYFQNQVAQLKEHATLDLIFPIPNFIRLERSGVARLTELTRTVLPGNKVRVTSDGDHRVIT